MSLWWMQPGWTDALCSQCGARIWPEGDPDWGKCYTCFTRDLEQAEEARRAAEAEQLMAEKLYREFSEPEPK